MDTTIKLLNNVDITNEYINTFSFGNVSSQVSFFLSKANKNIDNATFQRLDDGTRVIRVLDNAEDLRAVNYVMFQNETGGKWYFAFITNVVFKNKNVSFVYYEVDVIQTWYFEMDIKESFVEREHVSSDNIGEHLVDEGLRTGDLVVGTENTIANFKNLATILAVTELPTGSTPLYGQNYTGVYSGLSYIAYHNTPAGISALNLQLQTYNSNGKIGSVYSIFTIPDELIGTFNDGDLLAFKSTAETLTWTVVKPTAGTTIDGYVPKNKKLLSFPYNFIRVSNNTGGFTDIKYERCSDANLVTFNMRGELAENPSIMLSIENYLGESENYDEGLEITGFPTCAWITDVYANWLAQNKARNVVSAVGSVGALAFGVATLNPVAIGGGVLGVASTIGGYIDKDRMPNQARGNIKGSSIIANERLSFTFKQVSITSEFARIIDEYLYKYGYKVNRVKTPNITGRPVWNYVKTNDANIVGNVNHKDLLKIKSIFNNGITFWHSDNVGNYSLDNTI